jgi:serine/threonine protein kinase
VIGQVIGNFRLVSQLGRGGMGEVFLGEHTGIQTRVAVKLLLREVSAQQDHVQRFFNEARIVGKIKHAGIVKIFDVGFHEGQAYLIMELLEGESLAKRIERRGRMSATQLADIARQIGSVLAATHDAGVTHRDLKPDNIFLVADAELGMRERVKILDFGIAKLSGGTMAAGAARTVGTMGTPAYMAPEQWADSGSVDWRADAYSLGCVAFEMACGRPPFVAHTIAEAYTKHTQVPPPPPRSFMPDLPTALDALIVKLLAKDPGQRGASMQEIARGFAACGGGEDAVPALAPTMAEGSFSPTLATPSSTVPAPPVRANTTLGASLGERVAPPLAPRKRLGWLAAAGGGAALAAAIVVTVGRTGGSGGEAKPAAAPAAAVEGVRAASPPPPPPAPTPAQAPVAAPPPVEKPPEPRIMKPKPRTVHPTKPATPAAPAAIDNPLEGRT